MPVRFKADWYRKFKPIHVDVLEPQGYGRSWILLLWFPALLDVGHQRVAALDQRLKQQDAAHGTLPLFGFGVKRIISNILMIIALGAPVRDFDLVINILHMLLQLLRVVIAHVFQSEGGLRVIAVNYWLFLWCLIGAHRII